MSDEREVRPGGITRDQEREHNDQCRCFSPEHHPGREMTPENVAAYELQRLEYTEACGLLSPAAKERLEELRAPVVAARKAAIDQVLMDEVIRPAMDGLRARSCPSCHSIGPVRDGCADSWHSGDTTGISAP